MKNITVSVDDDTYRLSRIRAAELDTSVSALVRGYLRDLVGRGAEEVGSETLLEQRRRLLREVVADFEAQGVGLRSIDNLSRDELYDRDRARAETAEEGEGDASL
ncbi:MAG: hypothetical protein F4W89_01470 [Acidobacteria bacterium]|nr:hypothetical protein [Acidobacteriota bacterium]